MGTQPFPGARVKFLGFFRTKQTLIVAARATVFKENLWGGVWLEKEVPDRGFGRIADVHAFFS